MDARTELAELALFMRDETGSARLEYLIVAAIALALAALAVLALHKPD